MRRSLALGAIGLSACLTAPAGAEAAGIGLNEVNGVDNLYVRPKPQSFAIGTLFRVGPNVPGVEHITVQEITPGGWAYGYVHGSFEGCGWVDATYLKKDSSTVSVTCPTDDATRLPGPEQLFSEYTAPDGSEQPYHVIDCAPANGSRSAYGNYRAGAFRNKYGELPVNLNVGWRYTTKDGQAAMVLAPQNGAGATAWFFVPRSCIAKGSYQPPAPAPAPPPPGSPSPAPGTGSPAAPGGTYAAHRRAHWRHVARYCRHHRHKRRCRAYRRLVHRCRHHPRAHRGRYRQCRYLPRRAHVPQR